MVFFGSLREIGSSGRPSPGNGRDPLFWQALNPLTMKPRILRRTLSSVAVLLAASSLFQAPAQTIVSVGSGTAVNGEYPIRSASVGTYSQQIYLQSEINQAGNIIGIRFFAQSGGTLIGSNQWTVWVNTTTTTEFATFSDWKAQGTQRFNGTVTWPGDGEWMQMNFASPHNYANTQNLVITVKEDGAGNNLPDGNTWGVYAAGQNRGMRNIASSTGTVGPTINGSRTGNINRIQLIFDSPCTPQTANAGTPLPDICQGGTSVALGGSVGGSATMGQWSSPQGGVFLPDATTLNATYTPPPAFSGTATLTLTTTNGCNTPVSSSKTLLVHPSYSVPNPQTICQGESYVFNGNTYTVAGTYSDVLQTANNGCDSTIVTVLTVNDPVLDTTVGVNGVTLTANGTGASYQWVDCDNGNAPIPGEVSPSFTPTVNGHYAVVLTSLQCGNIHATSACHEISSVGMEEHGANGLVLRPNPASDVLFVSVPSASLKDMVIMDLGGKRVLEERLSGTMGTLDIRGIGTGTYIVRINTSNGTVHRALVKQD